MGERAFDMQLRLKAPPDVLRAKFLALRTGYDVAELLEVPYAHLAYHLYRTAPSARYKQFQIPKKSGGFRTISSPSDGLKILQAKLSFVLKTVYKTKPSAHGFAHKRSVLTNAQAHAELRTY